MKNANMPAMPVTDENGMPFNDAPAEVCSMGLTKREHFAGLAMQGLIANDNGTGGEFELCAEHAVKHADELLAQLENTK